MIRTRFNPVTLCGDLKKAFYQTRIEESDRDVLRFHWLKDLQGTETEIYRFTRVVFGLSQSPFILGATIQLHIRKYAEEFPDITQEIINNLYVDDLISGGETLDKVREIKETSIKIFHDAGFVLHKWHSNFSELEENIPTSATQEQTYAKQSLGVQPNETKILGTSWNKETDTLYIEIPGKIAKVTKRNILKKLASIYDILGIFSPCTLVGKIIFRETCELKLQWDEVVPKNIEEKWLSWEEKLPSTFEIPRPLSRIQESITDIDLHIFGDASLAGTSAVAYCVIRKPSEISQGLLLCKSRLSKQNTTIPRLELNAAVMVTKLSQAIEKSLTKYHIKNIYGWSDSTVTLHWIQGNGSYKVYVQNRVNLINSNPKIQWRYINTKENPADISSRGCHANKLDERWIHGPDWLQNISDWPPEKEILPSKESEVESNQIKLITCLTADIKNVTDQLFERFEFWKVVRVVGWIKRFQRNSLKESNKLNGPLTTDELCTAVNTIIKVEQKHFEADDTFIHDKQNLNLIKNSDGVYECRGRIAQDFPVYVPKGGRVAEKLIQHFHKKTLHGGVILTMAAVREKFWIPKLRQQIQRVMKNCYGCKRYQSKAYDNPPPGKLTSLRTQGERPFQVIGLDFAGPIMYRKRNSKDHKSYILLFTCSLSRAIHLELLPNQTVPEFIRAFKRVIARRGIPEVIFSDNAKTFVAANKWVKQLNFSEELHQYLSINQVRWQFNLSRAPWWGGQFERMVGLLKNMLYKTVKNSSLFWSELEEVLLDIETNLNNRPLTYIEEDITFPVITPNVLLIGQYSSFPTFDISIEDTDVIKRMKYVLKCKNAAWDRWRREYIKSLRERHNLKHKSQNSVAKLGEVVIIQSDDRNRGKWTLDVIIDVYPGKDDIIRAVKVKTSQGHLERAVQHLYPLELSCDIEREKNDPKECTLNPDAKDIRPRRDASAVARCKISDMLNDENELPIIE